MACCSRPLGWMVERRADNWSWEVSGRLCGLSPVVCCLSCAHLKGQERKLGPVVSCVGGRGGAVPLRPPFYISVPPPGPGCPQFSEKHTSQPRARPQPVSAQDVAEEGFAGWGPAVPGRLSEPLPPQALTSPSNCHLRITQSPVSVPHPGPVNSCGGGLCQTPKSMCVWWGSVSRGRRCNGQS